MQTDNCYVYYDKDTLYVFPSLVCTDGGQLPGFVSTTRDTYSISRGRLIKTESASVNYSDFDYSPYVVHVYHGESFLDFNYLVLPCTLLVICFFTVIYKWFIRLRG